MTLLTEKEKMQCALNAQAIRRAAEKAKVLIILIILLCGGAVVSGITEYAVALEIFSFLKAPLPGEEATWSVGLLSMIGILMALSLHLHAHQHPDSVAVRALRASVAILVPLYGLGAGAALAAIVYFDGADALFHPSQALELFTAVTETSQPSALDTWIPYFSVIFVLGCGGLGVISLYLTHTLLTLIRSNIELVREQMQAAKEAAECWRIIQECDRGYAKLFSERNLLAARDSKTDEVAFAHSIVAAINNELLPVEQKLTAQQLRIKPQGSRFEPHEDGEATDFKELQRRVAAIKAIAPKTILAAFRD